MIFVMQAQVQKIEYMRSRGEDLNFTGATIIWAELCGCLLCLRRSEHFS